jgi:hypothetical protein
MDEDPAGLERTAARSEVPRPILRASKAHKPRLRRLDILPLNIRRSVKLERLSRRVIAPRNTQSINDKSIPSAGLEPAALGLEVPRSIH